MPPELRITHTSSVTEDQIDHLGHMNVVHYGRNAIAGTRTVLADLPGWDGRPHFVYDTYTRHHREQLLGTDLVVRSAFIGASREAVRVHHELAAAGTGVFAATFVHGICPIDEAGTHLPVPDDVVAWVQERAVALPDYAATRTISLDSHLLETAPTLATVLERDLAFRKPRVVGANECDDNGNYRIEMAPALTWAGEAMEGDAPDALRETSSGELMGWASMETRGVLDDLPRVGARIQSFAATVAIHDKVIHRVNWCFDLDTAALITAFESVSMAFDVRGRKAISIPDGYRRAVQDRVQLDLVPQTLA